MRIYLILYCSIILFSNKAFGQKWETLFGNPGTYEYLCDLKESYDNGYLIVGYYEQNDGCWLIKTDLNGSILWEKFLSWPNISIFDSFIDQDESGNIYLASVVAGNLTGNWPMITKLDSCGEKVWCRVIPQSDDYLFGNYQDVMVLENNDILALAQFESLDNLDQVFLDYIDADGNLKWRQVYASQNVYTNIRSCFGDGIQKYGDNYIIHGHCYYPYPSDTTHFYQRPLFIMLDSLFNELWIIPFGVNDSIIGKAYHTIALNDSIFIGVGVRRLEGVKQNSLMMFFNNLGEELGYAQIPNEAIEPGLISNLIHDITRMNDTLFLASVNYGYENTTIYPWGEMILDTASNIYDYTIRSNSTTGWTSMVKTFDNKYTIGCSWDEGNGNLDIYLYKINENLEHDTVYPGNYTYDSLCPYQIQSGEIDISDCMIITDVGEIPTPKEYYAGLQTIQIKAYPNPVNGNEVTFEFQNTEYHQNLELRCYNIYGKIVYTEKLYRHQGKTKLDVSSWNSGMCVALVYTNNKVVGQTKFVVKE